MNSYIDMHAHILPGLDDGAKNSAMALKMLRQAQAEGIQEIILTPHYKPMRHNSRSETVRRALYQLEELRDAAGICIRLYLGNEVYYGSDVIRALREERAFTMAGSSCVLVDLARRKITPISAKRHIVCSRRVMFLFWRMWSGTAVLWIRRYGRKSCTTWAAICRSMLPALPEKTA